MKVMVIPIVIGSLGRVTKGLIQGLGGFGDKRTSGDHPNDSIIMIGQNTETIPGDLRRLATTQIPLKNIS